MRGVLSVVPALSLRCFGSDTARARQKDPSDQSCADGPCHCCNAHHAGGPAKSDQAPVGAAG